MVTRVNVGALCEEVLDMIRHTSPESIHIDHVLTDDLAVHGERDRLQEVLMALCTNAREAMPNGGRLVVGMQLVPKEELPASCELRAWQTDSWPSVVDYSKQ